MADLKSAADLLAASQQTLIEFLHADLALCLTFADLAATRFSIGDNEAAERVLSKAEQGHTTIRHFLTEVQDITQRLEIGQNLAHLRAQLDALNPK